MRTVVTFVALLLLTASSASAHVPFIEWFDWSWWRPLPLSDVQDSIAAYAWLKNERDVDVYAFDVTEPTDIYANVLVPVCPAYQEFYVSFALVGPGLPNTDALLPFPLPDGYGAIVVPWTPDGTPRPTLYEPFGAKWYYEGPELRVSVPGPGRYALVYWDPAGMVGDYVAAIGERESFDGAALVRALINTPIIRRDGELHTPCGDIGLVRE